MLRPLPILMTFVLFGCTLNPRPPQPSYVTTYDCSVSETRGALRLRADVDVVGWIERIDDVSIQGNLHIHDENRAEFQQNGFRNQRFDHPILFFDYPAGLKPDENATIDGQPLDQFFGGARGSGHFIRKPVAINVFLSLNWKQVQLLQSDGGMFVFLYDRFGKALKTLHLSRTHFDDIERSLKSMYTQVRVKLADKERLCAARTYEVDQDIIIVD